MSRSEVVDYLVKYDPVFAAADPEVLRRFNQAAGGKPRWWGYFLRDLRKLYGRDVDQLTDEMIQVTAAAQKKRPPKRPTTARRRKGRGQ